MSLWERRVQKRDRYYDPVKDREQKIDELREVWSALEKEKFDEKATGEHSGVDLDEASYVTGDVARYFEGEKAASGLEKRL